MKEILIRGPLLTQSGYGVHSRQIFRWALSQDVKINVQLLPWGHTPWYCNKDDLDGLVGKIMDCSSPPTKKPDLSLQIQLPNEWDSSIAQTNIGITAGVESTFCNPEWIQKCKKMDHIIVPSEFTRQVFINSGLEENHITVISESYHKSCETAKPLNLENISTPFNFLTIGQFTGNKENDRKNTFATIENFLKTFKDSKDVGLIIKTNLGRNCAIDRRLTKQRISKVVASMRKSSYPKVYLLHGYMKEEEIAGLYKCKKIKAFISGTRGEGFGLPFLEAASCNLPVIATNWSGHKDFLDCGKWLTVKYNLNKIPETRADNNIWMKESSWAEVDQSHLSERLIKFYKAPSLPGQWANKLGENVREKFCSEKIEEDYTKILSGYIETC